MIRRLQSRATVAALAVAAVAAAGCGDGDARQAAAAGSTADAAGDATARAAADRPRLARSRDGARVSTVATGVETPWDLAFLPDGRALVTERPGRVRLLSRGRRLRREPLGRIMVSAQGEGGLLGVAVDPRFGQGNDFVYFYFTTSAGMEVARYRLRGTRLSRDAKILDGIEAGAIHDSGRIRFGPDGRLYVSTGDAGRPELAQDPGSRNGKYLRLDPEEYRGDGGRPEVFSRGHRNAQGFAWQPRSRRLISTEHGPDGDDEVNLVTRGGNYGWPRARGRDHGGFEAPLVVYPDAIAPSGATFVTLPRSAWSGDFLFAALRGEQLRRVRLDGRRVTLNRPLFRGRYGRLRTVVEAPDGSLYVLTNNRDGRGAPRSGDDRILRVIPPAA